MWHSLLMVFWSQCVCVYIFVLFSTLDSLMPYLYINCKCECILTLCVSVLTVKLFFFEVVLGLWGWWHGEKFKIIFVLVILVLSFVLLTIFVREMQEEKIEVKCFRTNYFCVAKHWQHLVSFSFLWQQLLYLSNCYILLYAETFG